MCTPSSHPAICVMLDGIPPNWLLCYNVYDTVSDGTPTHALMAVDCEPSEQRLLTMSLSIVEGCPLTKVLCSRL